MSRERNRIIKQFGKNAVVERNKNQSYTQYCLFVLPAFCGLFLSIVRHLANFPIILKRPA